MDITILAIGSRGDVQPLVALGLGLQKAGHEILVASHTEFEGMVENQGLNFFPIQVDSRELLATEVGQTSMESGSNPLVSLLNFASMIKKGFVQSAADCLDACREAEMIIYSPLGFYIAPHLAEKLKVPVIGAYLQPFHRTRAFPSYVSPTSRNLGGLLNILSYYPADALFWLPYRSAVNQILKQQWDLPSIPIWVNQAKKWQRHSPVLYGFSPAVVPKPSDWGDHVEITGYWFLQRSGDWKPPPKLVEFLEAGSPPVCIGFGSMSTRKPKETTEIVLQALSHTQQRGILLTGWGGLREFDLPENVLNIEAAPHDWLFPKMAAVVHHGGAGTTAAGLKAGTPTIIVPHFVDQPFWGQRVADLGVGPQPIPRKELSVKRLVDAITAAVNDEKIRRQASELGERIRTEDGVARAVEVINKYKKA